MNTSERTWRLVFNLENVRFIEVVLGEHTNNCRNDAHKDDIHPLLIIERAENGEHELYLVHEIQIPQK